MGDLIEEVLDVFGLGFSAMHTFIAPPRPKARKAFKTKTRNARAKISPIAVSKVEVNTSMNTDVSNTAKHQSDIRTFLIPISMKKVVVAQNDGLLTDEDFQYFIDCGWTPDAKNYNRKTLQQQQQQLSCPKKLLFDGATGELSNEDMDKFVSMGKWNTTMMSSLQRRTSSDIPYDFNKKKQFKYYDVSKHYIEGGIMSDIAFEKFIQDGWSTTKTKNNITSSFPGVLEQSILQTKLRSSMSSSALLEAADAVTVTSGNHNVLKDEKEEEKSDDIMVVSGTPDEWEYVVDDINNDDDFSQISSVYSQDDNECVYAVHSFELIL